MAKRAAHPEIRPAQRLPTTMPSIVPPDFVKLEAEVQKWDRRAKVLHRSYLVAAAAAVVAVGGVIFLFAQPLLGPMLGDVYFFGSPAV